MVFWGDWDICVHTMKVDQITGKMLESYKIYSF